MARPTCTYDTGSMYGNAPACNLPATLVVTQAASGGYPPITYAVCRRHESPLVARIFPTNTTTAPIGA